MPIGTVTDGHWYGFGHRLLLFRAAKIRRSIYFTHRKGNSFFLCSTQNGLPLYKIHIPVLIIYNASTTTYLISSLLSVSNKPRSSTTINRFHSTADSNSSRRAKADILCKDLYGNCIRKQRQKAATDIRGLAALAP